MRAAACVQLPLVIVLAGPPAALSAQVCTALPSFQQRPLQVSVSGVYAGSDTKGASIAVGAGTGQWFAGAGVGASNHPWYLGPRSTHDLKANVGIELPAVGGRISLCPITRFAYTSSVCCYGNDGHTEAIDLGISAGGAFRRNRGVSPTGSVGFGLAYSRGTMDVGPAPNLITNVILGLVTLNLGFVDGDYAVRSGVSIPFEPAMSTLDFARDVLITNPSITLDFALNFGPARRTRSEH